MPNLKFLSSTVTERGPKILKVGHMTPWRPYLILHFLIIPSVICEIWCEYLHRWPGYFTTSPIWLRTRCIFPLTLGIFLGDGGWPLRPQSYIAETKGTSLAENTRLYSWHIDRPNRSRNVTLGRGRAKKAKKERKVTQWYDKHVCAQTT